MCYVIVVKAIPEGASLHSISNNDHLNNRSTMNRSQLSTKLAQNLDYGCFEKIIIESFCQAHYMKQCIRLLDLEPDKDGVAGSAWNVLESRQGNSEARWMPHHHRSTTWFTCIFEAKLNLWCIVSGPKWMPMPSISRYGHSIRSRNRPHPNRYNVGRSF